MDDPMSVTLCATPVTLVSKGYLARDLWLARWSHLSIQPGKAIQGAKCVGAAIWLSPIAWCRHLTNETQSMRSSGCHRHGVHDALRTIPCTPTRSRGHWCRKPVMSCPCVSCHICWQGQHSKLKSRSMRDCSVFCWTEKLE